MDGTPSGNVSVIEVGPEDLPERCRDCRFFDFRPVYDEHGDICGDLLPVFDAGRGVWGNWTGSCRRHPPTTEGALPKVSGTDVACGDGIGGREVWEPAARRRFDAEEEERRREERRARDMEATRDMRHALRSFVGESEATTIAMILAEHGIYTLDRARSLGHDGLVEFLGIGDSRANSILKAAEHD